MKAADVVKKILRGRILKPTKNHTTSFAAANIALIKYWGKRNIELNLPVTSSLSITLPTKGTRTTIATNHKDYDKVTLNGNVIDRNNKFFQRLSNFLDLFRSDEKIFFDITTENNIPTSAGLASSASGFAAIVKAMDQLFSWKLSESELSILSRIGSGSASRSLWNGFVEWNQGSRDDGMDSFAIPLHIDWPELCVGLLIFEEKEKTIGSTQAMINTVDTSTLYQGWPQQVTTDLKEIKVALAEKDFVKLGSISERNAIAMHATMLDAKPPIDYCTEQTKIMRQKIWDLRISGVPIYFTQDAGPNLKLLFLKENTPIIEKIFPNIEVVSVTPFT